MVKKGRILLGVTWVPVTAIKGTKTLIKGTTVTADVPAEQATKYPKLTNEIDTFLSENGCS